MKNYCMKKQGFNLIAIILFTTFSIHLGLAQGPQGFQGVIEFTKSTAIDTTDYAYYVKGDMIRIEEIGLDKKVAGIFLVNIRTNKAKALSPERKLYMDQTSGNAQASSIKNIEVIKGKNTKTIAGYKCKEVMVKNKDQGTQITYYLAKDDFHFFDGMLIALNRKDKLSTYYQQIPDSKNMFPFYAAESDLNGKQRVLLSVTKVTKKELEDKLFEIPPEYKKFEK